MKRKVVLLLGAVVLGGSLVVGFTKVDAPSKAEAKTEAKENPPTKEEIHEMLKDYPTNTPLTGELSEKLNEYRETVEMNEVPSFESMEDDKTVKEAVAVYLREDNATQKKIRFSLISGSLLHFITFEKGFYPQELLDQSVERDVRILESVKTMSDNTALNKLIDSTIDGITSARANGDPIEYFKSWTKLDAFGDIIGELSRPKNLDNSTIDEGTTSPKVWKDVSTLGDVIEPDFPTNVKDYIANEVKQWNGESDEKLLQAGYPPEYDYFIKSYGILAVMDENIRVEGIDLEKDFHKLQMLAAVIQIEQDKRTEHIKPDPTITKKQPPREAGKKWKPVSDRYLKAVEYLKQLLNDINVVVNGTGEPYGVSEQLDGDKIDELDSFLKVDEEKIQEILKYL